MPPRFQCSAPKGRPARRHARRGAVFLSVALLLVLAGAACGGKQQPTTAARPSTTAKIEIVSPTPGQTVNGSTLHVVLKLTGGTIIPTATATPIGTNEGHIHLYDNGSIVSMAYGTEQDISLTPGPHLLEAEFVASDHISFSPKELVSVHITAQ